MTTPPPAALCRRYELRSRPNRSGGSGFTGWFSIPGKDEQSAREDTGAIAVFDTEDEAISAAGEDMCAALNARTKFSYKHGYRRMGGSDFAVALHQLGISPSQFAAYYGTDARRVLQWIDGEQDIPHPVNLVLTLLAVPGMITLVQRFTDTHLIEREKPAEAVPTPVQKHPSPPQKTPSAAKARAGNR